MAIDWKVNGPFDSREKKTALPVERIAAVRKFAA